MLLRLIHLSCCQQWQLILHFVGKVGENPTLTRNRDRIYSKVGLPTEPQMTPFLPSWSAVGVELVLSTIRLRTPIAPAKGNIVEILFLKNKDCDG